MSNYKVLNTQNLNIFLISVLPISLVIGSLISNIALLLICIFFIAELFIKKKINLP